MNRDKIKGGERGEEKEEKKEVIKKRV